MTGDGAIQVLLAGSYVDSQTGAMVGVKTRSLVIENSLAGMEGELIKALGMGRHLAVVSDAQTHAALGRRVERSLSGTYTITSVILPGHPHPDDRTVEAVRTATAAADGIIAVGSGTINDLCKYAASVDNKPYAVFATAPSMNGYTSANAAITVRGHKMSLAARVPAGAFFDLKVLAGAPARLIRAGLGDSLCRCTAQADWLLSHLLFGTDYRLLPFDLLAKDEAPLFDNAAALVSGDLEIMRNLVRTLVLAGFGTAIIGHSQPASQGEHLISHYLDMFESPSRPLVFHGEQVGVTTLSMARLQQKLMEREPVVHAETISEDDFIKRYGMKLGASCWAQFEIKRLTPERVNALNETIRGQWTSICAKLDAVMLAPQYLESVLKAAGAPTTPEEIHLPRPVYDLALFHARDIRNRFTHLDLAMATGELRGLVPSL